MMEGVWILMGETIRGMSEELREGNHDQNILGKKKTNFNKRKENETKKSCYMGFQLQEPSVNPRCPLVFFSEAKIFLPHLHVTI